jgi:hypothetical protein
MFADRPDQGLITPAPVAAATGRAMQFNDAIAGGAEFIKVRNIRQECHQGSGDRMWEERETAISGPQRMITAAA